jgi:hypothetical protein
VAKGTKSGETELKLKHLAQTRKGNCGQTVVAMITGRPIEEIEEVMGKKGGTRTADLKKALHHYGWKTGKRLRPCHPYKDKPPLTIVSVRSARMSRPKIKNSHWIIKHNHTIYDPACDEADVTLVFPGVWRNEMSFLEVWK